MLSIGDQLNAQALDAQELNVLLILFCPLVGSIFYDLHLYRFSTGRFPLLTFHYKQQLKSAEAIVDRPFGRLPNGKAE